MCKKLLKAISWVLVSVIFLVIVGCGSNAPDTNTQGQESQIQVKEEKQEEKDVPSKEQYKELTVYTALPEAEFPTYFNTFEKETGIKILYVRLSAGEILAKLQAEKNNPQASLFYGGSTDNFYAAVKQDLLEQYTSTGIREIPPEFIDKDGYWTPFYIGAISFACNKDWFQKNNLEYPKSWNDLLKPEFKDQISLAHPSTSGTSYTILATIVQIMGEEKAMEYLKELDKNVRQYTKSGGAVPMQVGLGEAAIGITFSHDALNTAGQGYPIELSFPEEGTGFEIGGIGIIKGGPEKEKENAKIFIDWCISKAGQELFETAKAYRMPLNKNANPPVGAIKIEELKTIDYDAQWAGENRKRLVEKFTQEVSNTENLLK